MPTGETDFAGPIITAAAEVAKAVSARALFVYANAVDDLASLREAIRPQTRLVLVCRDAQDEKRAKDLSIDALVVPAFDLTRMGQIKMATLLAFSQHILEAGDVFVFLSGVIGRSVDTIVTMRVGEEYELFQSVGQPKLTEHIRRPVFERVLRLTLELAHEGREGKPVGALFVVGDYRNVQKYCVEGRINPFKGYTEKERNILDDSIGDTVKEIAKLDGAFILKGNGVIMSACAILRPALAGEKLPQGLGARHAAAAAITASSKCLAITLSESTGDVCVWRLGTMITEIERSPRTTLDGAAPPARPGS
ncbi:MAG: DNA integrity scanning protein DisA nucleotide-binding domain protein [Planctomycetota bacterium]|jgi:DNA integrity scanning protein DisA with diadenylate cyclase activity